MLFALSASDIRALKSADRIDFVRCYNNGVYESYMLAVMFADNPKNTTGYRLEHRIDCKDHLYNHEDASVDRPMNRHFTALLSRYKAFSCEVETAIQSLKANDVVWLIWSRGRDHRVLSEHGLARDDLYMVVSRKVRSKVKEYRYHVGDTITEADSFGRMTQRNWALSGDELQTDAVDAVSVC